MTTKEQERKALEKIRNIVEELGADSYLSMAFEGCFELAEENIDNDFGCSMYQRVVSAELGEEKANAQLRKAQADLKAAIVETETVRRQLQGEEGINANLRESVDRWKEHCEAQDAEIVRMKNECDTMQEIFRQKENEIVWLKARLYDLMYKGEE